MNYQRLRTIAFLAITNVKQVIIPKLTKTKCSCTLYSYIMNYQSVTVTFAKRLTTNLQKMLENTGNYYSLTISSKSI